jgi:hypothetical protein
MGSRGLKWLDTLATQTIIGSKNTMEANIFSNLTVLYSG